MADDTLLVNNLFDEDVTIDNETFPWVSAISIKAKFNAARQVTIQFSTREGLEMCNFNLYVTYAVSLLVIFLYAYFAKLYLLSIN